jgi:hypothetical protein
MERVRQQFEERQADLARRLAEFESPPPLPTPWIKVLGLLAVEIKDEIKTAYRNRNRSPDKPSRRDGGGDEDGGSILGWLFGGDGDGDGDDGE